jgi:hypothetical protein
VEAGQSCVPEAPEVHLKNQKVEMTFYLELDVATSDLC